MGKARSFSDSSKDIVYQKETNNENYAMSSQQNAYNLGSTHFSDQSGIGNFSQSGNDQRKLNVKGGLIQGNIGHILQTAVLDVDTETINLNNDSSGVALSVISEDRIITLSSGSTGTLSIITGVQRQGQRLTLYNISTNTITITHTASATVNTILTPDDNDFTFSNSMVIKFIFDITTAQWRLVTGVSGGSGGGGSSQTPWIQAIDGAGFTLTDAGNITIKNTQTDGLKSDLTLERNDTSATDGDTIGDIFFKGPTSTLATATWASINVESSTVTNTSKQGELTISVQHNNTLTPILNYTANDATLRISTGIDILRPNANGSKELGTSSFFWDDVFSETFTLRGSGGNTTGAARTVYADTAGMVFNMPTSAPVFTHSVNNEIFSLLSNGELEIRTTLTDGPTLRLRNNDQTPTDNDTAATILFTGEDSALSEQTYGAIVVDMDVVTIGSKQSDMTFRAVSNNTLAPFLDYTGSDKVLRLSTNADVLRPNANGSKELGTSSFFWDDVFSETFTLRGSGGNTTGAARTVYADTSDMIFNMPTDDGFSHSVNGIVVSQLTDGELELITTTTDGPTLRLRNNDQTPTDNDTAATILFTGEDSALAELTYGSIDVQMDVVTSGSLQGDMVFRCRQDNSLKVFMNFLGDSNKMGLFQELDMNSNPVLEMGGETINALTADVSPDSSTDFVMTYDASATSLKKVLLDNLPSGGGSGANTSLSNLSSVAVNSSINMLTNNITFNSVSTSSISADSTSMFFDVPAGDKFTFRINSTEAIAILANGNLDVSDEDIVNIDDLSFSTSGIDINSSTSGLSYEVPTGDSHIWQINNTNVLNLSSSQLVIGSAVNTVNFQTADLTNVDDIAFADGHNILSSSVGLEFNVSASNDRIDFEVESGNLVLRILNDQIDVSQDLDMGTGITVDWASTQSTVGSAGGASSLPATPSSYIIIKINGGEFVIPAYAQS